MKQESAGVNNKVKSGNTAAGKNKTKSDSAFGRKKELKTGIKIHEKEEWRPGNMLYPIPAVLVSVRGVDGIDNLLTVAWTGTVCSDPVMLSISVRPSRYSYHMLMETGEFVVNLTTRELAGATDYCGVRSGAKEDKWAACGLHKQEAVHVNAAMVEESPVNIECRVEEIHEYGSHTMFVARVLAVHADRAYMDKNGKFDLTLAEPIVYSHGDYHILGDKIGSFGYSVKKPAGKSKEISR